MKTLLFAKAAVEVLAGLALALFPVLVVPLLLGSPLDAPVGEFIGRLAGVALLALGIACWLARKESQGRAAAGLIVALLFYDAAVVVILLFARLGVGVSGIGLWPAVALHSRLGVWSVLCLRKATQLAVER
jgi:riboflavin transporter FmnP